MNTMKRILARFYLGVILYNYKIDDVTNAAADVLINEQWVSLTEKNCRIIVVTHTNKTIEFWNENKYYAWMSTGTITNSNKTLSWNNGRPDSLRMYRVLQKLKEYRRQQINNLLQ